MDSNKFITVTVIQKTCHEAVKKGTANLIQINLNITIPCSEIILNIALT